MAVMASMTVADGATTPVDHTFNPVTDSPPEWVDSDAAILYKHQQKRLIVSIKRSTAVAGINRVSLTFNLPTGGDGVSVPANENSRFHVAKLEFLLPSKGIYQERKDLRTFMRNLLADAQIVDIVDNLNSAW